MPKPLQDRLPSRQMATRVLENWLLPERRKMPLAIAYYLTMACNARCDFCSVGDEVYGDQKGKYKDFQRDPEVARRILDVIAAEVPMVYFMGGEPTVFPGFADLMKYAKEQDLEVAVNTNGIKYVPEIAEHADLLVVSMHSVLPQKIDAIYGGRPGRGIEVLSNIERYIRECNGGNTQVVMNCVATGDNLEDVGQVARFVLDRAGAGVKFNFAPAIFHGSPDERLVGNPEYQALVDWLMDSGVPMACSRRYLELVRNFDEFTCAPNLIPGVRPNGDMIVPCPNLPQEPEMVNILEVGSIKRALWLGREIFEMKNGVLDTARDCRDRCHKTCYADLSHTASLDGMMQLLAARIRSLI